MSDKIYLKEITLPIVETGENETYSFVQTDDGLDTPGDAADSKETGDRLNSLKQDLTNYETRTTQIESGTYNDADGVSKYGALARVRNANIIPVFNIASITIPSGYSAWIYRLDASKTLIGQGGWKTGNVDVSDLGANTAFINFTIKDSQDASADLTGKVSEIQNGFKIIYESDEEAYEYAEVLVSQTNNLFGKGYTTQQTEAGYAYLTNVNVGSVVDIDTPTEATNVASLVVKYVTEGMRFKVFGAGTFNYLIWAWLDKDKKLISKAGSWESSGADGVIITAPSNAVYLVCSSRPDYTYGFSAQYMGATVRLDNEVSALMTVVDVANTKSNLLKNADFDFVFFSDIHGGDVNFQRIIEYGETNNTDTIINGGDTVARYLNDPEISFTWYAENVNGSTVDILSAVGNHDVWTGANWTKADATDIYDTFIKPLVTKFSGIVQPESAEANGLCYYYKDYGNVRVVVINAMAGDASVEFWDTTQATWFENVLNDSITNTKHVIVCNHAPFPKNIAQRDDKSNWNSWLDYRTSAQRDAIVMATSPLDLIKAFINNNGKFICLLTGHEHVDSILTATGYDGQFMVNIASAKWSNHDDGVTYSSPLSPYYDCFNHCAVDTTNGIIKVIRVGWNIDEALKERIVLSYDYFNHKLINE